MNKFVYASLIAILVLALSGCATTITSQAERTRILDAKNTNSLI